MMTTAVNGFLGPLVTRAFGDLSETDGKQELQFELRGACEAFLQEIEWRAVAGRRAQMFIKFANSRVRQMIVC